MQEINKKVARYLECEPASADKNKSFSYLISKEQAKISAKPTVLTTPLAPENNFYLYLKLTQKNNHKVCSISLYDKGSCVSEYSEFYFKDVVLETENDGDTDHKYLCFVSSKQAGTALQIELSPHLLINSTYLTYTPWVDYNENLSLLLDCPPAQIDADGVAHYRLTTKENRLVVSHEACEEENDNICSDGLHIGVWFGEQGLTLKQYSNNTLIACNNFFEIGKMERQANKIIVYPKNYCFGRVEIQLEPYIKVHTYMN